MIKGVNKQVVIVKATDSDIFEEAIFIVRTQASKSGVNQTDMLTEAKRIIDDRLARYSGRSEEKRRLFKKI